MIKQVKMDESFIPIEDSTANSLFKFDKRILLITLKRKIIFIMVVSFMTFMLFGVYAKINKQEKWIATAMLVKYDKQMTSNRDIPYLYQDMTSNTLMESFYRRINLIEMVDSLGLQVGVEKLHGSLWIKRGNRANTYQVSAQHFNRELAVDMANTYARIFIKNYNQIINEPAKKTFEYYRQQVKQSDQELQEVLKDIRQFQRDYNITSIETEVNRKNLLLSDIELNIMEAQVEMSNLEARIADIDEILPLYPDRNVPTGFTVDMPIDTRIHLKEKEIDQQLKIYTPENPRIKKLYNELSQLKEEKKEWDKGNIVPSTVHYGNDPVLLNLKTQRSNYANSLSGMRQNILRYQEQVEEIRNSIRYLSSLSDEFQILKNREDSIRRRRESSEDRMVEAKVAFDSNVSDFEIIDEAFPPRFPEATRTKMIALVGGLMAFIGLTIYYLLREFLDDTIKSDFDFDKTFNIKLLGEIPNKDSFALEVYWSQVQIVFGQINAILRGKRQSFIAVGNDRSGTGKSFFIREVHDLYMSRNRKVLWIETIDDSDKEIEPYIINETLYNDTEFDPQKNIYELSKDQFKCYFLRDEDSFVQVLEKSSLVEFLGKLKDFDVIIWELFEVPYNMQLFTTIASVSDILIMVARFRYSNRENFSTIIEFLKDNLDIEVTGVLNDIQKPYFQSSF
jgi:polysaccharide biosynthesis transport protein